jgi:hypothetical protein
MRYIACTGIDWRFAFPFAFAFTFCAETVVVIVVVVAVITVVVVVVVIVVVAVVVALPFSLVSFVYWVGLVFVPLAHFVDTGFDPRLNGFVVGRFPVPIYGVGLALAYEMPVPVNVVPRVVVGEVGLQRLGYWYLVLVGCHFITVVTIITVRHVIRFYYYANAVAVSAFAQTAVVV